MPGRQFCDRFRRDRHSGLIGCILDHERDFDCIADCIQMFEESRSGGFQKERRKNHHAVGSRVFDLFRSADRGDRGVFGIGNDASGIVCMADIDRCGHQFPFFRFIEFVIFTCDPEEGHGLRAELDELGTAAFVVFDINFTAIRVNGGCDRAYTFDFHG